MFTANLDHELIIESELWVCHINPYFENKINEPKKHMYIGRFSPDHQHPFLRFYGQYDGENIDKQILDVVLPYMDESPILITGLYVIAKTRREILEKMKNVCSNTDYIHHDTIERYFQHYKNEKPEWLI